MFPQNHGTPDVFSRREIARAAGVATADVRAFVDSSDMPTAGGKYLSLDAAIQVVTALRRPGGDMRRRLFAPPPRRVRLPAMPAAASGTLHAALLAALILMSGLGVRTATTERRDPEPVRLVFLATPGPGGGGGGGGLKQPTPAPRAQLKGETRLKSPVTVTRKAERKEPVKRTETPPPPLPAPTPEPKPEPPPVPQPSPTPPVVAPVVSAPSDTQDRAGVATDTAVNSQSQGQGTGGGSGTGRGTGMGEGDGAGIGDGSIAGVGGGPYRPGSGITPPSLQREVKPVYTDEGRRRGIQGDVVMEVVVRADGTIGAVKVLQGLGAGLDQRAIEAVRQWRFDPARRRGTPVDVMVEIAVEFRLR